MTNDTQELRLHRGIPASGKSTEALKWVAEDPNQRVRVNRDDIRFEILGEWYPTATKRESVKEKEARVTIEEHNRIQGALSSGKSVVVDNTNLNPRVFGTYGAIAKNHSVPMTNRDFPISIDEALKRNAGRDRKVPEDVIRGMYNNYLGPNGEFHLFPGSYPVKPFIKPLTKEQALIVDMDGTFADVRSIRHHVRGKFRNFDMFHRASLWVPPNPEVIQMVKDAQDNGLKVVVLTARSEPYREVTQKWLDDVEGINYENIYMRPEGDVRKDAIVKAEILHEIKKDYDIVHAIDDNPALVPVFKTFGILTTRVPGFTEEDIFKIGEKNQINIVNPIRAGLCLRCGRPLKNGGILGPECAKIS